MSMKRTFVILGSLLILGAGVRAAAQQNPVQEKNKVQERNKIRSASQGKTDAPLQKRLMFRDENGDGICDSVRVRNRDGVPKGQDQHRSGGKDGKGNQSQFGNKNAGNKHGIRNGQDGSSSWNNRSFRQNRALGGNGVCGKDGSRGNLTKGGKN